MSAISPIEAAIDRATGFKSSNSVAARTVLLRCRGCSVTKRVWRDRTDPKNATTIDCLCPKCDDGGSKPEVLYFDAEGNQFDPDGNVIFAAKKASDHQP